MFHSLYARYQQELSSREQSTSAGGAQRLFWPASYAGDIVPASAEGWTLTVNGLVARPQAFTLESLKTSFAVVRQSRRLVSAQGWTVRANWRGIPLRDVVASVAPDPQVTAIRQTDAQGRRESLPLRDALTANALLCIGVDDQDLPPLHGGPLWLAVFDRFHYKGLGQLTQLEFLGPVSEESPEEGPAPYEGFWQQRGYSLSGDITPGEYYAFDLGETRTIRQVGEITSY
ncbi:MAG: molybdopterin-dependent oxidoreductase [Vampirovibrionales bacterium]|nr:molybdopterin-dependent oxidoreductase [Vampirovibrionales bacterium]